MKVLSVASEIFPLVKTGGLADVAGALPGALQPLGVSMLPLVPGYPSVVTALEDFEVAFEFEDLFSGPARLLWGKAKDLDVLVLEADHLYRRSGSPYLGPDGKDWGDNAFRYAALCWAAAEVGRGAVADFKPDIIHCHDWQAGLVPAYLKYGGGGPKTVMTVHNLAFPGWFPYSIFTSLRLPDEAFAITGVEYFGGIGFLKSGLQLADALTTVSPTYAREIQQPENGMAIDGLLRERSGSLQGIVNGIDTAVWNPAKDDALVASYTANTLSQRAQNKAAIERRFGLQPGNGPLFCVVSRLTSQKGMDLLAQCLPYLIERGGRLAILGSGDAALEQQLQSAVGAYAGRVGISTQYDETLSHLMQGGADAILVPSRFEPCGLTQLYGLRYGCVPVVSRVGGLADTVIDANDAALAAGVATGIQFSPVTAESLQHALSRAFDLFAQPALWTSLQKAGMKADVSWARSAKQYADLYSSLAEHD